MKTTMRRPSWLTWSFTGRSMTKGALQALGGIGIYVLAIFLVLKNASGSGVLRDALQVKLQGAANAAG